MFLLISILIVVGLASWICRYYIVSLSYYLWVRLEKRRTDFQLLGSLRDALVHERKKKIAGLEMIVSTWEKGEQVRAQGQYFHELLEQLKYFVHQERCNFMAVTRDVWLWAKLSTVLKRIESTSGQKDKKTAVSRLKKDLEHFQNLINDAVESATRKFSFTLNEAVRESVKIVRIEKSYVGEIKIKEELDDAGDVIRFSYDNFKDWQRILTNLIRNAVEAVEAKRSTIQVAAAGFSLRGGAEDCQVKVSTEEGESGSVSVIIEDSGIGMDRATKSSFYKRGFTSGKEHGLGLGVTEESMQFIDNYGRWQIQRQKGTGTKITINIDREKAQKAELILPPSKPFLLTKPALVLLVLLLILGAFAIRFATDKYSRFWVDWNPATIEVEDKTVAVVKNKAGDLLWRKQLITEVSLRSLLVMNIDQDEKNEVLIGTRNSPDESGELSCFSYKGEEMWRFIPGRIGVFGQHSPIFHPSDVISADIDSDGEIEIVVVSLNTPFFPCQIAVLDHKGRLKSEYWHPGHARPFIYKDIDDDGLLELLCGGVNNRLQFSAVVFILDGDNIKGQSPPYTDGNLPKASEQVYVKIPYIKGIGGENQKFSLVHEITYMGKENGTDMYRVVVNDMYGISRDYMFDGNLSLKWFVHNAHNIWQKLKEEGIIDYGLTPEVIESWKEIEVWKDGVKVR